MKEISLAVNKDGRLELFFINAEGTVVHTWQLNVDDKTEWSAVTELRGQAWVPLNNAIAVSAVNDNGLIQVVAKTSNGDFYICYQTNDGPWQGWNQLIMGDSK